MDLGDSLLGSSLANKKPLRLGRGLMQMLLIAICSSLFGGFLGGFFRDLLGWLGSGGDRCGYLLGGGFLLAEDTVVVLPVLVGCSGSHDWSAHRSVSSLSQNIIALD
jgi:hypothetical protein